MALFEGSRMRPARYSLDMVYAPLEDIPEPQFPPGIAVRTWVRGQDDEAVLAAFNEVCAPVVRTYRTNCDHWGFIPVPLEDWLHWANLPRFRPELNLLAVAGEEIAGICLCDVNQEHIARLGRQEGWVDTLGVRRPYRHQGLGRALLLAGLHVLKEAGMESAMPLVLRHLSCTLGPEAQGLRATSTGPKDSGRQVQGPRTQGGKYRAQGLRATSTGPKDSGLGVDAESLTGATRLYESVGFVERRRYVLYRRPL